MKHYSQKIIFVLLSLILIVGCSQQMCIQVEHNGVNHICKEALCIENDCYFTNCDGNKYSSISSYNSTWKQCKND